MFWCSSTKRLERSALSGASLMMSALFLLAVVGFFFLPQVALAEEPADAPANLRLPNPLESLVSEPPVDAPSGDGAVTGATTVALLIGRVVQVVLGLLGVIGFVVVVLGGIVLLTSGGDHSKIEKGRGILVNAVVGTLVALTSYLIIRFVIDVLQQSLVLG